VVGPASRVAVIPLCTMAAVRFSCLASMVTVGIMVAVMTVMTLMMASTVVMVTGRIMMMVRSMRTGMTVGKGVLVKLGLKFVLVDKVVFAAFTAIVIRRSRNAYITEIH
jgi:hypothetical protein